VRGRERERESAGGRRGEGGQGRGGEGGAAVAKMTGRW